MQFAPHDLIDLTSFVHSYLLCAAWSSIDDDGIPLDAYPVNWHPSAVIRATEDCAAFLAHVSPDDLDTALQATAYGADAIAHDCWLTRNGHGCGFWDGDYPDEVGYRLTILAHAAGECYALRGDDGLLYLS